MSALAEEMYDLLGKVVQLSGKSCSTFVEFTGSNRSFYWLYSVILLAPIAAGSGMIHLPVEHASPQAPWPRPMTTLSTPLDTLP